MNGAPTWVVGAGGLLGSHVVTSLRRSGPVLTVPIPWADPAAARRALCGGVHQLAAVTRGGPWQIAWCAGPGVVATDAAAMDEERGAFSALLEEVATARGLGPSGAMFVASSAGGVYAGSTDQPPFTENSAVRALVAYGRTKLDMERQVTRFAESTGTAVLIGRIANLYGPGQNLAKAQGLVSQLSRAQLTGQPLTIYVSLDTKRDYVYAADVGDLVAAGLQSLRTQVAGNAAPVVVKVVATGNSLTIGALVGESTRHHRRRPRLIIQAPRGGSGQVPDLRLRSVVWPDLDVCLRTPMTVGLARTADDVAQRLRRSGRAP